MHWYLIIVSPHYPFHIRSIIRYQKLIIMKYLIIFCFTLLSTSLIGQQKVKPSTCDCTKNTIAFDSNYIASKIKYFKIEDNKIVGEGSAIVEELVKESQFVSLGEIHGSAQISKLTSSLMPLLKKNKFKNFALEVGPNSGEHLETLLSNSQDPIQALKEFNSKYYFEEAEDFTMPFVGSVEDAEFLKIASENKMDFWGLDQEYYYAIFYLSDQLLELAKSKSNYNQIQQAKIKADATIKNWFITEENSNEEIDVFGEMWKDENVQSFFSSFNEDDTEAQQIISNLKISWDIYTNWRRGSHDDRISYMRENFINNYTKKVNGNMHPRVFVKMGALHTSETLSHGSYDVGYLLEELASKNNTISSSMYCLRRYMEDNGEVADYIDHPRFKRYRLILSHAKKDQFGILDLRQIRRSVKCGRLILPTDGSFHKLLQIINSYDYQILLPVDYRSKENTLQG